MLPEKVPPAPCSEKYISLYTDITIIVGLVQQPDKIVVRFALTIYPYSLDDGYLENSFFDILGSDAL